MKIYYNWCCKYAILLLSLANSFENLYELRIYKNLAICFKQIIFKT